MLDDSDATSPLAQSCIEKLAVFLSDKDQNLRYIALKGLSRLLRNAPHTTPLLARHYDDILACINEEDLTIRLKALELVERLTDRSNCKSIVTRLIEQISPSSTTSTSSAGKGGLRSAAGALRAVSSSYDTSSPSGLSPHTTSSSSASASSFALAHYRYRLLLLILRLTSRSSEDGSQLYVNITNFEWYVDTLVTCAYLSLSVLPTLDSFEAARLASKLSDSLVDVTARAPSIRPFALRRCKRLTADPGFVSLSNPVAVSVISACAFVMGEYTQEATCKEDTEILVESTILGSHSTGVCLGVMQCLARWLSDMAQDWQDKHLIHVKTVLNSVRHAMARIEKEETSLFTELIALVVSGLDGPRTQLAMQTRSTSPVELTQGDSQTGLASNSFASSYTTQEEAHQEADEARSGARGPPQSLLLLSSIFAGYELRPLAANAQSLVTPPDSLDLDSALNLGAAPLASMVDMNTGTKREERDESAGVDEYGRLKISTTLASSSSMVWNSSQEQGALGVKTRKGRKKMKQGEPREGNSRRKRDKGTIASGEDVESIPIVKLELSDREGGSDDRRKLAEMRERNTPREKATGTSRPSRPRTPSPPPIILSAGGEAPSVRPTLARSAEKATQPVEPERKEAQDEDHAATVHDPAAVKVIKKKKRKKVQVDPL